MGFGASSVPTLTWDFTTWLGDPNAKGITREPSKKVIDGFIESFRGLIDEVGGEGALGDTAATSRNLAEKFSHLSEEERETKAEELNAELFAIVVDLTQGCPSVDQLQALQDAAPRIFNAYLGWLFGMVSGNPEA